MNLDAARGSVRSSAGGNALPVGVALAHVRVVARGVGAVVPSLGVGRWAVVGVAVGRILPIKPAPVKSIPVKLAKSVESVPVRSANRGGEAATMESTTAMEPTAAVETSTAAVETSSTAMETLAHS